MSILSRARSGYAKRFFAPSGSGDPWAIPSNGSLATFTTAGVPVSVDTALQVSAVAACLRIISETISGMPFDAVTSKGRIRIPVEPAPRIVVDPFGGNLQLGSGLTRKQGLAMMIVAAILNGNAFAQVTLRDDSTFLPTALRILPPDLVRVKVDEGGMRQYWVRNVAINPADMLHITGMSLAGAPVGLSAIQILRRDIGIALAAAEYGSAFFGNGAHLSGLIEHPGDLDRDRARQVKENFESKHSGLRHAHAVGVLTGGAIYRELGASPEQAQFLGTRSSQTLEIARFFGVPPHLLMEVDRTTSWGRGIEEQNQEFVLYTLSPWAHRFEDAWSAMLPLPMRAKFNFDSLLRPSTLTRYQAYQAARNAGVMTPNEVRALEDLPPVDGGDDLYAPLNSAHTKDPGWTPGQPEGPDNSPGQAPAGAFSMPGGKP